MSDLTSKFTALLAHVRRTTRRAWAWCVWSPRNAAIATAGLIGFLLVLFVAQTTPFVMGVQQKMIEADAAASAPTPSATRSLTPGEYATRDPWVAPTVKPTSDATRDPSTESITDGAAGATATKFVTLYLAGANKPPTEQAAWQDTLRPYTAPAMAYVISGMETRNVPTATITGTQTDVTGNVAAVAVTISSGKIYVVQLMGVDGSWTINGFYSPQSS